MPPSTSPQTPMNDGGSLEKELLAFIRERAASSPFGQADIEECQEALGIRAPTLYALLSDLERHQAVDLDDVVVGIVRLKTGQVD